LLFGPYALGGTSAANGSDSQDEGDVGTAIARQQELLPLISAARTDEHFAGAYFDGDRLTLVTTSPAFTRAMLADLVPSNAAIVIAFGANDFAALTAARDQLLQDLQAGTHDFDVKSVYVDPRRNRVIMGISQGLDVATDYYSGRLGSGLVDFEYEDPGAGGGLLACTKNDCGTKGGLTIKHVFSTGFTRCTSRFLVRRDGSSAKYVLTAGHCVAAWGGTTTTVPWKNGAENITWGKSLNYEFDPSHWVFNDQGVFSLGGIVPSAWNEYYTGSPLPVEIVGELPAAQQVDGIAVCRHGYASGWGCGTVTRSDLWIKLHDGTILSNTWEVRHQSAKGDSGAGYIFRTVYGVYLGAGILSSGENRAGVDYTYYFPLLFDIRGVEGYWAIHPCATTTCNT
jgi:hypothetical protein